jgi:hypothetical protein
VHYIFAAQSIDRAVLPVRFHSVLYTQEPALTDFRCMQLPFALQYQLPTLLNSDRIMMVAPNVRILFHLLLYFLLCHARILLLVCMFHTPQVLFKSHFHCIYYPSSLGLGERSNGSSAYVLRCC